MRRTLAIIGAITLVVSTVPTAYARTPHAKPRSVGKCHTAKCATAAGRKACQDPTVFGGFVCNPSQSRPTDFGASGPYVGVKSVTNQ